jgi:ABC-type spermidine/putrescine transport system permease subunit II
LQTFDQAAFLRDVLELLAIAVVAVPAALLTTAIALLVRRTRWAETAPLRAFALVGIIIPLLIIVDGFRLSWPWPWRQPEAMQDGIPPGPWLLMASPAVLLLCLATGYAVIVRRQSYRDTTKS